MKISYWFVLLGSCLALPAWGQKVENYAFLRVAHYCDMPYMMPDYFQEAAWTDSLMRTMSAWLKNKMKVQKVDYKLRESIVYHPTRLPVEEATHNFSLTNYAYFAELQTGLTLGNNKQNLPALDKGTFELSLKVYDQAQRKVLQKSLRVFFSIQPHKDGGGDVWLTAQQFKQLYRKALQRLMTDEKPEKTPLVFQQMLSDEVTAWLPTATKTTLIAEGRGKYTWARGDSTIALLLELQVPYYADKTHRREATFSYGQQAGKMQLKGLLAERNPKELFIQFTRPQFNLAALQNNEVLDLSQTETKRNAWTWLAYKFSGMVKVYEGDALKAVLMRNSGGYDCYLVPRWTNQEAQTIAKLLVADVLVRALQKQYEVR